MSLLTPVTPVITVTTASTPPLLPLSLLHCHHGHHCHHCHHCYRCHLCNHCHHCHVTTVMSHCYVTGMSPLSCHHCHVTRHKCHRGYHCHHCHYCTAACTCHHCYHCLHLPPLSPLPAHRENVFLMQTRRLFPDYSCRHWLGTRFEGSGFHPTPCSTPLENYFGILRIVYFRPNFGIRYRSTTQFWDTAFALPTSNLVSGIEVPTHLGIPDLLFSSTNFEFWYLISEYNAFWYTDFALPTSVFAEFGI
jgi:hypothetical protein